MCNFTQFAFLIIAKDTYSEDLPSLFMKQVVLSFGMVSVVVVDADSKFFQIYKEICTALDIKFWPLSRGNHKGMNMERYHMFLNKA